MSFVHLFLLQTEHLWMILKDGSLDVELRVGAYAALMRCPDEEVLRRVTEFLNREEDTSLIGAYIFSHLRNLNQTSDPHKQELARAVKK